MSDKKRKKPAPQQEPAPNSDKFTDTGWGHWEILPGAAKEPDDDDQGRDEEE